MRAKVVDIANEEGLNPDQMVAFAWEYDDKYDTSHPQSEDAVKNLENATIDASQEDELIKDFKYANRKGHDWRDLDNKIVKESLYEELDQKSDPIYDMGIGIVGEIKKYCNDTIKACQTVIDEYAENDIEFGDGDADEDYCIANNEGRIEACEEILRIIKEY